MTCYKSIVKKRTPCQAVSNKLDVEVAPKQLQNLRKLEKVFISKKNIVQKSCKNTWKRGNCKNKGKDMQHTYRDRHYL